MTITLNGQQQAGLEKIRNWYDHAHDGGGFTADVFRLFGYAGTGKTTMAKYVAEALGARVAFGAFTGKAASVLRTKGATPVSTIHSAIYFPTTSAEARRALEDARADLADNTAALQSLQVPGRSQAMADESHALEARLAELEALIPELEANARRMRFEFNPDGPWADLDLIILDEVSMVGAKIAADIESYGVPILVLGDPAQLPPVEGGGYYTNAEPDHLLTEVQRTALESPVLALATRIRESMGAGLGLTQNDLKPVSLTEAMQHDQILCWTNKRRWSLVNAMRKRMGLDAGQPVAGDRIMCLTNNRDLAVFNGQQFEVADVARTDSLGPTLVVRDLDTGLTRELPVFAEGFEGLDMEKMAKGSGAGIKGGRMLATFSQAITVHKAQGSEWPSVYVADETPAMISMTARREGQREAIAQGRQWLYTATTRASERVTIARTTGR
jgi:exodeoxyribonuclease-5